MSVHGEYGRALEALLVSVKRLDDDSAAAWVEGLVNARSSRNPDLSTAARACMNVLDTIDLDRRLSSESEVGPDLDSLREPFMHLRSHCHAVLGAPIRATTRDETH